MENRVRVLLTTVALVATTAIVGLTVNILTSNITNLNGSIFCISMLLLTNYYIGFFREMIIQFYLFYKFYMFLKLENIFLLSHNRQEI